MSACGRDCCRRSLGHQLCAGLSLVAYLAAVLGFPVPIAARQNHHHPFPCQQHACGCANAESCWKHCCCFTPEQKLTWAHEQGIEPPAEAEPPCTHACCQTKAARSTSRNKAPTWRLGINCPRCQGHSTLWISTGTVLLAPVLSWNPKLRLQGWTLNGAATALVLPLAPPDPPPRTPVSA
jgi:hypothetical protein